MTTEVAKLDYAIVAMTDVERASFQEHEAIIDRGLATFVEVGDALLAIRDAKEYRETHRTFENYCQGRWGFTRMRASQLIAAAEVVQNVNNCLQSPTNEAQARPLSALEPARQREAWQRAVETAPNGKVTAAHVQGVVNEYKRPVSYHISDDSYEWFTPAEYIDAARAVMGGIDLDPASCVEANGVIKAKRFYTKQDSGLDHKWSGRIWMNPPYNMPLIEDFANRAIESYKSGAIQQATVLTNNSTDTGWFHALAEYPFCLTRGRIGFIQSNGERLAARQGQAIFYLGKNVNGFVAEFSKFGIIVAQYEHR